MEKRAHSEKFSFLKENGVCFGCLCIGHISRHCKKRLLCRICSLKHLSILHIHPKERAKEAEQAEQKLDTAVGNAIVSSGLTGDQECKLPIVPVPVKFKNVNKTVVMYAFLDQGRGAVFCTMDLMNKLNLREKRTHILLRTMRQEKVVVSHVVSGMEVAALDGDNYLEMPVTYTQERMPVHRGNNPMSKGPAGMASSETCPFARNGLQH